MTKRGLLTLQLLINTEDKKQFYVEYFLKPKVEND